MVLFCRPVFIDPWCQPMLPPCPIIFFYFFLNESSVFFIKDFEQKQRDIFFLCTRDDYTTHIFTCLDIDLENLP